MNATVPLVMFGWIPAVLVLFALLPPRRAVIVSFLGAWMFLPMAIYNLPGFPDITKMSVTCVAVLVGVVIFDPQRLAGLRLSMWDVPILAWILVPLPAAVMGGYGAYEGIAGMVNQGVAYGLPYFIGRLYFSDAPGLRELALGLFIGALVYVPFVLFEAKMSPQLHMIVYGYHQHDFGAAKRMGGWRPMVFMEHGLAVAMYMCTAAVCGVWMWRSGRVQRLRGAPMWALALGLLVIAAACRSSYAMLLMILGLAALFVTRTTGVRGALYLMLAISPIYVLLRTVGGWDASQLRDAALLFGPERLDSLDTRLASEDVLWRWAQGNLLFGYGRLEGLIGARDELGLFIPDALWLIALGKYGLAGLLAMFGMLLGPPLVYFWRHPPRLCMRPELAGATALATVLVLYEMDNLLNAMLNPIFLLAAGGLIALRPAPHRAPVGPPQRPVARGPVRAGQIPQPRPAPAPRAPLPPPTGEHV